jgi:hypothetical protein
MAGAVVATTSTWAVVLLDRSPQWNPWLRPLIVVAAVVAVTTLVASAYVHSAGWRRTLAGAGLAAAILASLGGPAAYAAQTISTGHTGSIPSAGPAATDGAGSGGGPGSASSSRAPGFAASAGSGGGSGGASSLPGASAPSGAATGPTGVTGSGPGGRFPGGSTSAGGTRPSASGANPGFGGGTGQVSSTLIKALETGASKYRWVAATDGSQSAASIELASGGEPVMAIGGFNGQGGNISLAQFEKYVAAGDIHYYIASGGTGGPGGGGTSSAITTWVEAHFTAKTIGGQTVYDLTAPRS